MLLCTKCVGSCSFNYVERKLLNDLPNVIYQGQELKTFSLEAIQICLFHYTFFFLQRLMLNSNLETCHQKYVYLMFIRYVYQI